MTYKEHDIVSASVNLPDVLDVPVGTEGTIVHVYPNSTAYEVEFFVSGTSIIATVIDSQITPRVI